MEQSRTRRRRGFVATAVVAVCVAGGLGVIGTALLSQRAGPSMPTASVVSDVPTRATAAVPAGEPTTLPSSKPVRLQIPSIGVDSVVQHLGQDAEGGLEVPAAGPH